MTAKWTEATIGRLPAGSHTDPAMKGLCLRVTPGGRRAWSFRWREDGRLRRETLGDAAVLGLAAAREAAMRLAKRAADPENNTPPAPTVAAYLNTYIDDISRPGGIVTWAKIQRDVSVAFGSTAIWNTRLDSITPGQIDTFRRARSDLKPGSCNRLVSMLVGMLTHARQRGVIRAHLLTKDNGFCWLPVPPALPKYLSADQLARLREAALADGSPAGVAIYLASYTGLRQRELLQLEWSAVDLAGGMLRVAASTAKTRRARMVPIPAPAAAALTAWRADPSAGTLGVWGDPAPTTIYYQFQRIAAAAGLAGVSLRTLRSTYASHLAMAGAPIFTIARLLGHADVKMTVAAYASLSPDHLRSATDLLT